MTEKQAAQRAKELREIIEKNNRLYYDQDAPELEDFEYDALNRELKEIEKNFRSWSPPIRPPSMWAARHRLNSAK